MATIQVCVDDGIKAKADSLFESLGLDTPTAMRMFIIAAVDNRGIPFDVRKARQPVEIRDGALLRRDYRDGGEPRATH